MQREGKGNLTPVGYHVPGRVYPRSRQREYWLPHERSLFQRVPHIRTLVQYPVRFTITSQSPVFVPRWGMVSHSTEFAQFLEANQPEPAVHSYFEWLQDQDELWYASGYRTQDEINHDFHGNPDETIIYYDAEMDAAAHLIPKTDSGVSSKQLRPLFPDVTEGNLLFTWDTRLDASYASNRGNMHTMKAFQLSYMGDGDDRRLEPRFRFGLGETVDVRLYGSVIAPATDNDPLAPKTNSFNFAYEKWTRWWAYVNFTGGGSTFECEFSLWVADEDQTPVQVYNAIGCENTSFVQGLNSFWFEYNSSQEGSDGDLLSWFRNFAVLKDVSDVNAVITEGEDVPG